MVRVKALTQLVESQEGHLAHKISCATYAQKLYFWNKLKRKKLEKMYEELASGYPALPRKQP